MKIKITLGEMNDRLIWEEYCAEAGLNPWCLNEGLADADEEVELTEDQARRFGLLPQKEKL